MGEGFEIAARLDQMLNPSACLFASHHNCSQVVRFGLDPEEKCYYS